MASVEVKSFNNPDEVNTAFNNAKMETVNVGGQKVICHVDTTTIPTFSFISITHIRISS